MSSQDIKYFCIIIFLWATKGAVSYVEKEKSIYRDYGMSDEQI